MTGSGSDLVPVCQRARRRARGSASAEPAPEDLVGRWAMSASGGERAGPPIGADDQPVCGMRGAKLLAGRSRAAMWSAARMASAAMVRVGGEALAVTKAPLPTR